MTKFYITKSKFISSLECPKLMWYSFYEPKKMPKPSSFEELKMSEGTEIGILAQQHPMYKNGTEVTLWNVEKAAAQTQKLLDNPKIRFIYEATFILPHPIAPYAIKVDILEKNGDGSVNLIEVKSGTSAKPAYLMDVGFQSWILEQLRVNVKNLYLMYANKMYVRSKSVHKELDKFFKIEDVTRQAKAQYEDILKHNEKILEILQQTEEPSLQYRKACEDCSLALTCQTPKEKNSVWNFFFMDASKKQELENKGYKEISDVPAEIYLNPFQLIQKQAATTTDYIIDHDGLNTFIESLNYPLYYLDFEAVNSAIPIFKGMKPHQFFVYQAGIQKENIKGAQLESSDFIWSKRQDGRIDLVKFLLQHLGTSGDIIVYSKSFEETRIRELMRFFPQYEKELAEICSRMKDLANVFRKPVVYHQDFEGSYSIKKVMPVLCPELSYKTLQIQNGSDSQFYYFKVFKGLVSYRGKNKILKDLILYNQLDVYAMYKILQKLFLLQKPTETKSVA